jgi:Fur family peroxide stress response transcriptional regulator
MPGISIDTVNRTLQTLAEIGAAFVVEGTGGPRRYDGILDNHQHFRCIRCRKVVDFHPDRDHPIHVPAGIRRRFKILRKTVYLEGLCDICRKESPN